MNGRYVIATSEESELLFELWRVAYYVATNTDRADPYPLLAMLFDPVNKLLEAGFIVPDVETIL